MSSLSHSLSVQSVLDWFGQGNDPGLRRLIAESNELEQIALLHHSPPHADERAGSPEPRADQLLWSLSRRIGVKPQPFWPDAPYALMLTHDIDRILSCAAARRAGRA